MVVRSLIEIDLLHAKTQLLVDTGARLSCISEQLLQCHELFKNATIRKSDKRAYGVNGEPVVTLGIVDLTFHVGGLPFSHSFTILRGLIHPMLLGMDFLTKHRARINLGNSPSIQLAHSSGKIASTRFIKAMPKPKPCTHVALAREVEIPPYSFYYADAYLANFDYTDDGQKTGKLLGITSVQKADDFFDPGFILRDAVIAADSPRFKVELANPSEFPLKIDEDTPLGMIFDYDCEILETEGGTESLWETPPSDDNEEFLRRQAMLIADVNVVEIKPGDLKANAEGPSSFAKGPICKDSKSYEKAGVLSSFTGEPIRDTGQSVNVTVETQPSLPDKPPKSPLRENGSTSGAKPKAQPKGVIGVLSSVTGDPSRDNATIKKAEGPSSFTKGPFCTANQRNATPQEVPILESQTQANKASHGDEFVFSMAYSDPPGQKLQYSDVHGKDLSQKERMYMINMDDSNYTQEERKQLETVLEANAEAFSRNDRETGCTDVICHHVKIANPRPVYLSYHKAQGAEIRKEIDDQTNSMLADGIVVESESLLLPDSHG